MSVAPTPREDQPTKAGDADSRHKLQPSTLPPVLFALPNLASACPDGTGTDDTCAGQDDACSDQEIADGSIESERAPHADAPVFEPVTETPTRQVETQTQFVEAMQQEPETAVGTEKPSPASQPKAKEQSAFDVWGTRAVVVTVLLLVISSAFVAAKKSREHFDVSVADVSSEISSEDLPALEGFVVSEGVDAAAESIAGEAPTTNEAPATPSNIQDILATADAEPATGDTEENNPRSVATLTSPVTPSEVDTVVESQPAETPSVDEVVTQNDAQFGPAEVIAASTASARIEQTDRIEAKKPADTASVVSPAAAITESVQVKSKSDMPALEEQAQLAADSPRSSNIDPVASTPADSVASAVDKPTNTPEPDSGAIRYSSTPNAVTNWEQYFEWAQSRVKTQTPTPPTD